jgi:hypothetical protein
MLLNFYEFSMLFQVPKLVSFSWLGFDSSNNYCCVNIRFMSDIIDKNAFMLGGCARNIRTRMIGGISMVKY